MVDDLAPSAELDVERRRRQTLGGSYLSQAVDQLRASGSADTLYPRLTVPTTGSAKQRAMFLAAVSIGARRRRVEFARSAILYSMLAAEAYANQYLQWHLTGSEFNAVDRLPTLDKYVLGPRIVGSSESLSRGAEPAQTLGRLLELRTRLVHPKLMPEQPRRRGGDEPVDFQDFNPRDAARYLVAVSQAAGWLLVKASSQPHFDPAIANVDLQREHFLAFGATASDELPRLGDEPAPDLMLEAMVRTAEADSSRAIQAE